MPNHSADSDSRDGKGSFVETAIILVLLALLIGLFNLVDGGRFFYKLREGATQEQVEARQVANDVLDYADLEDIDPTDIPNSVLLTFGNRQDYDIDWADWADDGVLRVSYDDHCAALVMEPDGDKRYTITGCDEAPASRTGR